MTGPRGGVIGVKREQALERFLTLTQVRFETSDRGPVAERRCWWRATREGAPRRFGQLLRAGRG